MKSLIIKTFIAVIFSAVSVFASFTEPVIVLNGTKSFVVNHSDWKSSKLDISILNEDGFVIYSKEETLKKSKTYSLDKLEEGNYVVILSNEFKTVKNNFTLTENSILIDYHTETTYKPIFNVLENNIDLNYLAGGLDTKIHIQDNESEFFETNIKESVSINKRFNITNLPSGDYTIVVSNKDGSYSREFTK